METKTERKPSEAKEELAPSRKSPLAMFTDAAMAVETVRINSSIRLSHLKKRKLTCSDTEELGNRAGELEKWVDGRLNEHIENHPAYWWFSHVKGCGRENIAKVVGRIERFGKYYDSNDPEVPSYVHQEPELCSYLDEEGNIKEKMGVWVEGIERLTMPSKLRKLAGRAPDMKREVGKKREYDSNLSMLTWRLGKSLIIAKGSFYGFMSKYKDYLEKRETTKGTKIAPTPKGRYCLSCGIEVKKKKARYCPNCKGSLSTKEEPEGYLFQGHLHNMARHRMEQMFLDMLWVVWRRSLGLPLSVPYPVEFMGHSQIMQPEDFIDKRCDQKVCEICQRLGKGEIEKTLRLKSKP